jgi:AcrR family transcriptional regulator
MISPRLCRENIVAVAIEVADRETLAAVTLRGIAAHLDVHVTSLYNHVPSKEALVNEMVNALIVEARLPTGSFTWREWVREFASRMHALALRHPGAFEAFHYGPAQGERVAASFEAAFAAFRAGGFNVPQTYSAVKATIVAVLGFALDATAAYRSRIERTDLRELPVERFPNVHAISRVAAKVDTFRYLIEALIIGFDASRGPAAKATPPGRRLARRAAS